MSNLAGADLHNDTNGYQTLRDDRREDNFLRKKG
jgi:hypothetical protein